MGLKRRDFLKLAAAAAGTLAADGIGAPAGASEAPAATPAGEGLGVLVDASVCISCRKCEWACNRQNHLTDKSQAAFEDRAVCLTPRRPDASAYTIVNRYPDAPGSDRGYGVKIQCLHCLHPACASACIVGALRKHPQGPVTYDAWKCIGCRYCMVACPFEIPAYEYARALEPRVMKCTFCFERVVGEGRVPACVEICPNEALTFGRRESLIDAAYIRMTASPERYVPHLYGEHEVGGTSWMYLAPADLAHAGLPPLDDRPIPETTERIQHGVFKGFVPPLALYGLLGLVLYNTRRGRDDTDPPRAGGHA
jgi:Fe-S-cluster-containing dehydrogenase component